MKKTLLICALFVAAAVSGVSAQTLTIKNNQAAPCPNISVVIYGHDNTHPCGSFISNPLSIPGGGTIVTRSSPLDVNLPACGGFPSGPGWATGCLPGGTLEQFDGADVNIGGTVYTVGIACFTASFSAIGTDCVGNIIHINYNSTNPLHHILTIN